MKFPLSVEIKSDGSDRIAWPYKKYIKIFTKHHKGDEWKRL